MFPKINTILGLFLASSLKAQPPLSTELEAKAFQMRANNLYHQLVWDFIPTNPYYFNQDNGTITYTIAEGAKTVMAELEIMGSFYLGDNTFLWADKNKSVDGRWATQVNGFRDLLAEPCRQPKFKTNVEYLKMLLAAFGSHLKANAVDYVRQGETILFFALKKVDIFNRDQPVKTIFPEQHGMDEKMPEKEALLQEYLAAFARINQQYNKDNNQNKGFDALDSLKAIYLENANDILGLQKPFNHTIPFGQKFRTIQYKELPGRVFILFSSREQPWPDTHKAYEVNPSGTGKRVFLQSFDIYGL